VGGGSGQRVGHAQEERKALFGVLLPPRSSRGGRRLLPILLLLRRISDAVSAVFCGETATNGGAIDYRKIFTRVTKTRFRCAKSPMLPCAISYGETQQRRKIPKPRDASPAGQPQEQSQAFASFQEGRDEAARTRDSLGERTLRRARPTTASWAKT